MCYLKGLAHGLIKSWKCRQLVLGTTIALRSIEAAFDPTSTPSSSSLHACILKCFATLYMWLHQCKQKTGVYQLWHKRGQHVLGTIKDGYWFLVSTHGCLCALSLDNRHIQWQVWRTRWQWVDIWCKYFCRVVCLFCVDPFVPWARQVMNMEVKRKRGV